MVSWLLCGKKTGRRAAYRDFVCQNEPEEIERFYALKNLPSVLGGAAFKEWLKDTFPLLGFHAEVPQSRLFFPAATEIIAGVCAHFQVSTEQMAVSRRGTENLPRDVVIYLVRLLGRETLSEVGKNFGMSNYSTVGSAVARVKLQLRNDRAVQKHLEEIRIKLDKSQRQVDPSPLLFFVFLRDKAIHPPSPFFRGTQYLPFQGRLFLHFDPRRPPA